MQVITHRNILNIAWPIILANLSTPLLGMVDTAVIGNLGDPSLIGAIAIGGILFSFIYWGFGFLRMGTTGLVAQAKGAGDTQEMRATFYRSLCIALFIGAILLLLQYPIAYLSFQLLDGSQQVEFAAKTYFEIRIWSAPISLSNLAIVGFLLGQQDTKSVLKLQLLLNGTNIILDFVFVVGFNWSVSGVATATVISEVIAIIFGLSIIFRQFRSNNGNLAIPLPTLIDTQALKKLFQVNRDLLIRTLCLLFAFAFFTNQGAQSGDILLSANAILMQFVTFAAFFLDGFALAAETLVGSAIGSKNVPLLDSIIKRCFSIGFVTSLLLSVVFWLVGIPIIHLLTNVDLVRQAAETYLIWAILAPILSFSCYLLDGIFIGATRTVEMRNAMILSLLTFLTAWYLLFEDFLTLGNHGLWLCLQIYFLARALTLAYYLPRLKLNLHPRLK